MSVVRAFIAIDLSNEVIDHLAWVISDLQKQMPSGVIKWSPPKNIHLTLKFLGDVSVHNLDLLKDALRVEVTGRDVFDMSVGGMGVFPKITQPRVIWVGIEAPDDLASLQRAIENDMRRLGYAREKSSFTPHLTLGRVARNANPQELRQVIQVLQDYKVGFLGVSRATAVHLYRSDLNPGGAVYTALFTVPLRPRE